MMMMMVIKRSVVARLADSVTGVTIPPNGAKLCRKYASHTAVHSKYWAELQSNVDQMTLWSAGQDSLVEHLGRGSNVNDVESIPGSCLAFGGTASVGLSAKKKKRNVKKKRQF